ncbi:MAG: ketopantoate reductase family protein [Candidatus Dormibacteraeota bacterium]|uniref:Ketopantoate reductase family protein n=1 Tax=Candidatus Amunia macphersoniae TaxID=3127014 RepID=A0A934NGE6_9BACT|nr:ketopantoate reductase family protein [Candidatus Dormibacteraeota bacterium]
MGDEVGGSSLAAGLESVPRALGAALVIPFLNSVEHVATLRERFPADAVAPATIRVEATRVAAGEIEHASPFALVELAASGANAERVERVAAALRGAGVDVNVRTDETAMLWEKLALLAPLALLTTWAAAPVGTVRVEHRGDMVACVAEVAEVARSEGAHVHSDHLLAIIDGVPESMQSSMQRDAAAGRPTELEAIGGAVLRAAGRVGIAVPVTQRLVDSLRERERMVGAPGGLITFRANRPPTERAGGPAFASFRVPPAPDSFADRQW